MNGACVGHRTVLMRSMLKFAMHFGCYRHQEQHNSKEHRRKGTPHSTPSPAIDIDMLLTNEEENLKLEQISTTHPGILDLLGDPGNPLYAEPHSMAKHFDTMMLGARALGQLPNWGHCKDSEALAHVYEDEARQACQKILCCLDVRVFDGWPRCPDLLTNAYTHTTYGAFYAAVLPPGRPGAIYLTVPQQWPRLPAAQGGHLTVPSFQEDSGCSPMTYGRWWMPTATDRS